MIVNIDSKLLPGQPCIVRSDELVLNYHIGSKDLKYVSFTSDSSDLFYEFMNPREQSLG